MVSEFWFEALLRSYSHFVLFFVHQGRGFEGFEGGRGYLWPPEGPQMEAMLILPISYFHSVAVKRLVFLSHTPSKYLSPLCTVFQNGSHGYVILLRLAQTLGQQFGTHLHVTNYSLKLSKPLLEQWVVSQNGSHYQSTMLWRVAVHGPEK